MSDDERDLHRRWWANPVTQEVFKDLSEAHRHSVSMLMGEAQAHDENLPAIKYYSGRSDALYLALGAMTARNGEVEEEDEGQDDE